MQNSPLDKENKNATAAISDMSEVKAKLKLPAIGIIVSAVINLVFFLIFYGVFSALEPENRQDVVAKRFFEKVMPIVLILLFSVFGFSIYGAIQMMNVKKYGFAMTSAIIHILTLICGVSLVGVPVGIWALIVLLKPEIKSAFARNSMA